jgi:hypothetical protein
MKSIKSVILVLYAIVRNLLILLTIFKHMLWDIYAFYACVELQRRFEPIYPAVRFYTAVSKKYVTIIYNL